MKKQYSQAVLDSRRKLITDKIDIGFDPEGPIDGTIGFLELIKDDLLNRFNASNIRIEDMSYGDSSYPEYIAKFERLETDAEVTKRLNDAQKQRELNKQVRLDQLEKDRREYERLKAKFDNEKN